MLLLIFFFTDTVNTAIYTLSLHDALPIYSVTRVGLRAARRCWIQFVQRAAQIQRDGIDERIADRKSTRLNSSHQIISYAVFCLKKKKKHTATTPRAPQRPCAAARPPLPCR